MDIANGQFLGMVGIDAWVFAGLSLAAAMTAFIAAIVGTAGGLLLIAVMAFVFPPALLIPIHTVVQLGAAGSMAISRWRYLMRETVLPFTIGTVIGAAIGGRIFVSFGIDVPLIAAMIATSFIGTWGGKYALDLIPERVFRIAIQTMLTLMALRLIWMAVEGF